MSRFLITAAGLLSAALLALSAPGTPAASAEPAQAFDFDTFVNIDCYFFSTGDEGIAFNGLGINYGSSSPTVHAYFKIDGPFALQASQILYDSPAACAESHASSSTVTESKVVFVLGLR